MQVRPGAERETRGLVSHHALARAVPSPTPPFRQSRKGHGQEHGGQPTASGAERRPGDETVGPPPAKQCSSFLPPVESAWVPPSSFRSGMARSWLPWALATCFHLLQKPHGSYGSSVAPGSVLRFLRKLRVAYWARYCAMGY